MKKIKKKKKRKNCTLELEGYRLQELYILSIKIVQRKKAVARIRYIFLSVCAFRRTGLGCVVFFARFSLTFAETLSSIIEYSR